MLGVAKGGAAIDSLGGRKGLVIIGVMLGVGGKIGGETTGILLGETDSVGRLLGCVDVGEGDVAVFLGDGKVHETKLEAVIIATTIPYLTPNLARLPSIKCDNRPWPF
jgi:hypothetical protein